MWSYPSFGGISFPLARGTHKLCTCRSCNGVPLCQGVGFFGSRDILIFYACPSPSTRLQLSIKVDQIIYSRLGIGVRWKSQTRRGEARHWEEMSSIDGLTCSLL